MMSEEAHAHNARMRDEWRRKLIDQYWWFLNSFYFENIEERPPEILASIIKTLVNEGQTQSGYINGRAVVNYYGKWYDPVLADYADIFPGDKYKPYDFVVPKEFIEKSGSRPIHYLSFAFNKFARPSPPFRDIPPNFFLDFWHFYGGPSHVIPTDPYDVNTLATFFVIINHEVDLYRNVIVFPTIGKMYHPEVSLDLMPVDTSVLIHSDYEINTHSDTEDNTDLSYFLGYLDRLYPMY